MLGKEGDLDLQGGKGGEGLTPQPMYGKTILSLAKWTHRLPCGRYELQYGSVEVVGDRDEPEEPEGGLPLGDGEEQRAFAA